MSIFCVLDHISMYGNVVTVYGSAPVSESSCWFGKPRYEVRLSETVRPIDEYNSLMWGKTDIQRKIYLCTNGILIVLVWDERSS